MEDFKYLVIEVYNDSSYKKYFVTEKEAIDDYLSVNTEKKRIYKLTELELEQKLIEKEG